MELKKGDIVTYTDLYMENYSIDVGKMEYGIIDHVMQLNIGRQYVVFWYDEFDRKIGSDMHPSGVFKIHKRQKRRLTLESILR